MKKRTEIAVTTETHTNEVVIPNKTPADEALKSIEGLRYKLALKYKKFCNESTVTFQDLLSVAAEGALWAYRDWNPEKAKFITFAFPRIQRKIDLFLIEQLPYYKENSDTKTSLRYRGEGLAVLLEKGYTDDEEFNEIHNLGPDSETVFTKNHYNEYVKFISKKNSQGNTLSFVSLDGPTFSGNSDTGNSRVWMDKMIYEDSALEQVEMEHTINKLDDERKLIASRLMEGATVNEIAKELKIPIKTLMKKYSAL